MGTLYFDIETASPFREPQEFGDFEKTKFFEPTIFAVGYRPDEEDSKTDLVTDTFFRNGPWGSEHDLGLYERLFEFCDRQGPIDRVVTHNGDGFDCIHFENWAVRIEDDEEGSEVTPKVRALLDNHIDLMPTAVERCREPLGLEEWRDLVSLDDACDVAGTENPTINHDDYDLNQELILEAKRQEDEPYLTNKQVPIFGKTYVDLISDGKRESTECQELKRALHDYAVSDITPLAELDRKWLS